MDVTMGRAEATSSEGHEPNDELGYEPGAWPPEPDRLKRLSELQERAQELMRKAQVWVSDNPFAALGIALATGFLAGRAMRAWVLRS